MDEFYESFNFRRRSGQTPHERHKLRAERLYLAIQSRISFSECFTLALIADLSSSNLLVPLEKRSDCQPQIYHEINLN